MTAATIDMMDRSTRGAVGKAARNRALVRAWLYVVAVVLFGLFLVGGATMGQLLSIPVLLAGLYLIWQARSKS